MYLCIMLQMHKGWQSISSEPLANFIFKGIYQYVCYSHNPMTEFPAILNCNTPGKLAVLDISEKPRQTGKSKFRREKGKTVRRLSSVCYRCNRGTSNWKTNVCHFDLLTTSPVFAAFPCCPRKNQLPLLFLMVQAACWCSPAAAW